MMCGEANFDSEHDEVVWYVLKRKLVRPETTFVKAFCTAISLIFFNVLIIAFVYYMLTLILASFFFINIDKKIILWFIIIVVLVVDIVIYSKIAAIGIIRLYQHYAPEHIRRKCLFKPTCSEYAILAIEKYGLIVALPKIYNRLFKRCRGHMYRVDYP